MIKVKLKENLVKAMKSGNHSQLSVLRYILSQIQNREIETQKELTNDEEVLVLKKIVKQFQESLEAAKKANRSDLVQKQQEEIELISPYLPPEITDQELEKEIKNIIDANKELYSKNPQSLIGLAVKTLKTKADPSRIMKILRSYDER